MEILGQGPRASAPILTEAMVKCRRKTRLSQEDTRALLEGMTLWSEDVHSILLIESRLSVVNQLT